VSGSDDVKRRKIMKKRRRFAILGVGSFGETVAHSLIEAGAEVLILDTDPATVKRVGEKAAIAVTGDCRDRAVLEELNLGSYDVAIVGLGQSIEASTLVTLHLRELGVRRIITKAVSSDHQRLLMKVGADDAIFPEAESARRLARQLIATNLLDYFELAEGFIIADVTVPETMIGKSLREIDLRRTYELQVLMIQEMIPAQVFLVPDPERPLKPSDILVVAGTQAAVEKLAKI
jgi:trk system potassium uptake protein TrkA